MALKQMLTIFLLVVAATAIQSGAAATEYIVGDGEGWKIGFNYTAWAEGKNFMVGDTLVFKYAPGIHNIFKVDAKGFEACQPPEGVEAMESGNDIITISSTGIKYYICGKSTHCEAGQKLAITVSKDAGVAPPPTVAPTPGSSNRVAGSFMALFVGILAVALMLM